MKWKIIAGAVLALVSVAAPMTANALDPVTTGPAPAGAITRPGFQYESAPNPDSCKVYIHPPTEWRPRRELHISCTIKSGSEGPGVTIRYRYPKPGRARAFGAVIEDESHGGVGDGDYVTAHLSANGRWGFLHVPGPHEYSERGSYVHIEKQWWLPSR
jgi:hypothetical protein